jgi:hypothetical protein
MLVEDILEAGTGHQVALSIDEELRHTDLAPDAQPGANLARSVLPERQAAFLAALSPNCHARAVAKRQVCRQNSDQF